jgi:hypothetical protein
MILNIKVENTKGSFDYLDKSKSFKLRKFRALSGCKGYKVHRSSEFQFGRVFKVLWSEPVGSGGTEITTQGPHGGMNFSKVRRFLIVSSRNRGHSICLPILTYGYQGVLKPGVHPEDHAVVYSSRRGGPYLLEREEGLMKKSPIRIEMTSPREKLDQLSRLNYAKVYTVEHNVKVVFIGRVAKECENVLIVAYNEAHPPLDPGPSYRQGSFEDLNSFAEQDDPRGSFAATSTTTPYGPSPQYPYTGPSYFGVGVASMAQPSSSQTAQAAEYPAYDDGYDY